MKTQNKFPQTLQKAIVYFSDPDNCLQAMKDLRWSDGVIVCPRCGSIESYFISARRIWECKSCKRQFSAKVGTVMEDSALGLDKWLVAIWMMANAKNGISSYEIHRALGITQKTAWFMEHRIRLAMQTGTFEKLSGTIEADETFVGGKAKNMHKAKRARVIQGRGTVGKTAVMGILQRKGEVRTQVIPNTDKETIQNEVRANVEVGSDLYTDSMPSYNGLAPDYKHEYVDHSAEEYVRGKVHTNGIENFWSLWKRCIKGTHVSIEPVHTSRYLDEEMFRFNNRTNNDAERFTKAVQTIQGKRLTYKQLTRNIEAD